MELQPMRPSREVQTSRNQPNPRRFCPEDTCEGCNGIFCYLCERLFCGERSCCWGFGGFVCLILFAAVIAGVAYAMFKFIQSLSKIK